MSDDSLKYVFPFLPSKTLGLLARNVKMGQSIDLGHGRGGTAVGFAKKYIGRGGLTHKEAGAYVDFTTVIVAPEDGSPDVLRAINLGSLTEIADIRIRISKLPDVHYWEGDKVMFVHDLKKGDVRDPQFHQFVQRILYADSPMLCSVGPEEKIGQNFSSNFWKMNALHLIERGNIYKLAHGQPLDFADIEKEAEFYRSLGMTRKACIRNGKNSTSYNMPLYVYTGDAQTFTFDVAMGFLELGIADEVKLKDRKQFLFVLIKYDNREFGRRMRKHMLEKILGNNTQ